jgi:hypothetical protein
LQYAALEGFYYFSEWKRNIQVSEVVRTKYNMLQELIERNLKNEQIENSITKVISDKLYEIFHDENQNCYRWYLSKKIEARI